MESNLPSSIIIAAARSNKITNHQMDNSILSQQTNVAKPYEEPAIFEFEEDLDKPVTKFLPDDIDNDETNAAASHDNTDANDIDEDDYMPESAQLSSQKEVKFPVACSVPVDIPLRRMATWQTTVRRESSRKDTSSLQLINLSDDDDDGDQNFQKPHELAAKTYQEYYLRDGLELDVPVRKAHIKTYL
jgi:hypothetical protein